MGSREELINQVGFWKTLPIETLMNFCQTNKNYRNLCRSRQFWELLLERDFRIYANPKQTYLDYYAALNYFSDHYDIITLSALKLVVKYIDQSLWSDLAEYGDETVRMLYSYDLGTAVADLSHFSESDRRRGLPRPSGLWPSSSYMYSTAHNYFRDFIEPEDRGILTETNDQSIPIVADLIKNGCKALEKYARKPLYIYIGKQLISVPLNFELVQYIDHLLLYNFQDYRNFNLDCYMYIKELQQQVLDLIKK